MKQHITKEQWDELKEIPEGITKAAKAFYSKRCNLNDDCLHDKDRYWHLSIGQMIEFLSGDLKGVFYYPKDGKAVVRLFPKIEEKGEITRYSYRGTEEKELCDALWEAVKYKLNES